MNLISENKKKRLLLEKSEVEGFIKQNLVDTSYIIREFTSILNAYNIVNNYETHIVSLKSKFTGIARKAFGLKKNRDFGLQHHAHDACMVALADACLSAYYPNYDRHGNYEAYKNFIEKLKENSEGLKDDKKIGYAIKLFRSAFNKKYNQDYKFLINQIKETVPLYSEKVLKKSEGQYYDMNIVKVDKDKLKDYQNNNVLYKLGINNDKRKFDSINCCAIDYYRYTVLDKKGNHIPKHIAIHIPRVIVDSKGNIDQEKYKILIKEHYKAKELLDENDNLKEYYFRFRMFKNDVIYDTCTNYPQIFNIGSIANKALEIKHVNMNSYDAIYSVSEILKNLCINEFHLKKRKRNNSLQNHQR